MKALIFVDVGVIKASVDSVVKISFVSGPVGRSVSVSEIDGRLHDQFWSQINFSGEILKNNFIFVHCLALIVYFAASLFVLGYLWFVKMLMTPSCGHVFTLRES